MWSGWSVLSPWILSEINILSIMMEKSYENKSHRFRPSLPESALVGKKSTLHHQCCDSAFSLFWQCLNCIWWAMFLCPKSLWLKLVERIVKVPDRKTHIYVPLILIQIILDITAIKKRLIILREYISGRGFSGVFQQQYFIQTSKRLAVSLRLSVDHTFLVPELLSLYTAPLG